MACTIQIKGLRRLRKLDAVPFSNRDMVVVVIVEVHNAT